MASKPGVSLDTVMINIESDAGKATGNIDALAASLEKLKSAIKGGFNNVNKLATGLNNLKSAAKGFESVTANISRITSIVEPLKSLNNIPNAKGLRNVVKSLESLPSAFGKIDGKALENITRTSEKLSNALTPLANKMADISNGYSSMSQMANTYGKAMTNTSSSTKKQANWMGTLKKTLSAVTAPFKSMIKTTNDFGKTGINVFKKMNSKVKQLGLSLLGTRTIFTMTRKAISEYMNMDVELTKSITNLWRALGAQLAPAVEGVMYLFKQFVRVVYSVIKAITGIDLIARANAKATAGWGKSAEDALGSLQKFDDLNVVDFGKGSGDENKLIDLEEIDLSPIQKIMDWVKKLKKEIEDALDTGKWETVGKVLGEGINGAVDALINKLPDAVDKFKEVATEFANFLNGAIGEIEWADVGSTIVDIFKILPDAISTFFSNLKWEEMGRSFSDLFKNADVGGLITSMLSAFGELVKGLFDMISNADWKVVGAKISEAVTSFLSGLGDIIGNADWSALGKAIKDVISNIKWGDVFSGLWSIIEELYKGLIEFVSGLTGMDMENSEGLVNMIGTIGLLSLAIGGIIKLFTEFKDSKDDVTSGSGDISKAVEKLGDGFADLQKKIGNAVMIISILGGIALVVSSLSELIQTFADSGLSLGEGIGLLASALGMIGIAFAGIAAATKLIDMNSVLSMLTIFGGLTAVLLSLALVMDTLGKNGQTAGDVFGVFGAIMATLVVTMGAVALLGPMMSGSLLPLLAVVASVSAILLVMAATIPTILEACGKFINDIAPSIVKIIDTIYNGIEKIIYAMGTVLPPIINAVGNVFNTIFNGMATVINSIGLVIINIMRTAGGLVDSVLNSILNFINRLGPAINNFVDNAIVAVTKLINFLISGIEYMINTLVIGGINGLIGGINKLIPGKKLDINLVSRVNIARFVPRLKTGTNKVPYDDMLAVLHKNEAVVPAKYNPAVGGGNSEEMVERLDRLIFLMENQEHTTVVNVGNKKLYQEQKKYSDRQYNKYGTLEV